MKWLGAFFLLFIGVAHAEEPVHYMLGMYTYGHAVPWLGRTVDFGTRFDDPSQWPNVWWEGAPTRQSLKMEYDLHVYPKPGDMASAAGGKYDSLYRNIAVRLAPYADKLIAIRIGSEVNLWSQDADNFKLAFRRFSHILKTAMPGVPITFNPNIGHNAEAYYPGDDVVDIIGLDIYEDRQYWQGSPDDRWRQALTSQDYGLSWLARFAAQHHKRIAIPEWGTNYNDGEFIRRMAQWMKDHRVVYQSFWDSNDAFPGALSEHPTNLIEYKQMFGKTRYVGVE
jgi:hypothetical protein